MVVRDDRDSGGPVPWPSIGSSLESLGRGAIRNWTASRVSHRRFSTEGRHHRRRLRGLELCIRPAQSAPLSITLIDRGKFSICFNPLLYQVATAGPVAGGLSPRRSGRYFAMPSTRALLLGTVTGIDGREAFAYQIGARPRGAMTTWFVATGRDPQLFRQGPMAALRTRTQAGWRMPPKSVGVC